MSYSLFERNEISKCLELCIDKSSGSRLEFLESLQGFYEDRGFLTDAQKSALIDIMEDTGVVDELD
jgi:hypothetical protein